MTCYADANYGSKEDRKSTSGFLIKTLGNVVSWTTKRQTAVALSSTEAEYIALATASTDLMWIKNLLADFRVMDLNPPIIF